MSDQKNISPLLDGFTLGAPISEHHGVVCCPAIKENTTKKYIVKIISVPAAQAQFDALLLAGAYKDPGDAMEYFRENGESILKEAELLKKLSKIEGFLPYDGWQMEPITRRRLGYEIYLVGSYKRSLEKHIRKNACTHLEAINLALDLCSALSICRQSGYLYADLKPSNIYVSEKKEYRIGDLGFLSLDALRFVSLPERYFSPYTPPELMDPMTPMNLTVDTYAVGMILYQLYNDGHLPFTGTAPSETLPTPCQADYEMAEIIMKAIHPDPQQRWTDPKDLGKAIASYMQRNSVNDVPITTFVPPEADPEDIVKPTAQQEADNVTEPVQEIPAEESFTEELDTVSVEEKNEQEEVTVVDGELFEEAPVITEDTSTSTEAIDETNNLPELESEPVIPSNDTELCPEEPVVQDKTEDVTAEEISEEVARILSRADDIIAHEIPEETAFPQEEEQSDPFAFAMEDLEETSDDFQLDPLIETQMTEDLPEKTRKAKHFEDSARKKKFKKFLSGCFSCLILCGACAGGYWYYQNAFLQSIDSLSISGTQDQITVLIDTGVEEAKLSVHCTDANGKRHTEAVQNGKVIFSELDPSTEYTIQVDMDGFHKLIGHTTDVFTTEAMTRILSFQAIAGSEDGSVNLDFTVDGDDPDFWNIHYTAEGEEERKETVTGHSATITGLTVGKLYTFTLHGDRNFDLSGETSVQYLASRLIMAEDLVLTTTDGTDITVHWKTPGDVVVENWDVRCYDGYGFEEAKTVTETSVTFTGIDPDSHYTIDVTASGMTQPSRIMISADPIRISDFQVDESSHTEMELSWEYSGINPEGGWQLTYTVDGSGTQTVSCEKPSVKISPLVPDANYVFVLQSADERTVINNTVQHHSGDAAEFTEHNFVLSNVVCDLLKTPEDSNWHFETITEDLFTDTFQVGESASVVLRSSSSFYLPGNKTKVMFVFRDAYGNVLPELMVEESLSWKSIWQRGDAKTGEINIPKLPTTPGEYIFEVYFNGCFVAEFDITITA